MPLPRVLSVYADRRILTILLLGFSSGLPLALTGATLTRWLAESQIDLKTIGQFALVTMPYGLKFLWAPLVDRLRLPWVGRRFGQRRSWAFLTQAGLIVSILALSLGNPAVDPAHTAMLAALVAFCSASQDIVIDAYRVEYLDDSQQGAGNATYVLGYRFGMLTSGAGAFYIAAISDWQTAYAIMAVLVLAGTATIALSPEPRTAPSAAAMEDEARIARWLARHPTLPHTVAHAVQWLLEAVVTPFRAFMRRRDWVLIILFIAVFKAGDVIAGQMTQPFYAELGFSKAEVASLTKVFGIWALIFGGFVGGAVVGRLGVIRGLFVGGALQVVANLSFIALAATGHDLMMLGAVVTIDNVCAGISTTAFVAYLSTLCDASYTATQYALLSSVYKIGGDLLAATSGAIATALGWTAFFGVASLSAIPALVVLTALVARARSQ